MSRVTFSYLADLAVRASSHWVAFATALTVVMMWFIFGFFIGFENTFYQLLINTGTTIVTFLLGFLILHAQQTRAKEEHMWMMQEMREVLERIEGLSSEIHAKVHE